MEIDFKNGYYDTDKNVFVPVIINDNTKLNYDYKEYHPTDTIIQKTEDEISKIFINTPILMKSFADCLKGKQTEIIFNVHTRYQQWILEYFIGRVFGDYYEYDIYNNIGYVFDTKIIFNEKMDNTMLNNIIVSEQMMSVGICPNIFMWLLLNKYLFM